MTAETGRISRILLSLCFTCFLILTVRQTAFAAESTDSSSTETSVPSAPQNPDFSVKISVDGETNEQGFYIQNWDAAAQYPIADLSKYNYTVTVINNEELDLTALGAEIWLGDFSSKITVTRDDETEGMKFPVGRSVRFGRGTLNIDEHDVERGYMVLRVECTAECPDPAHVNTVSASDEITIRVCARPEKDIVAFLETEFNGALSEEELLEYHRKFFGDRYEKMKERVMAEEQQESETSEITETSKNPSENTEASSGWNIALLCIPGVVMVFGLAGILLWRRRKQCKG